jgi:hypothetical protein
MTLQHWKPGARDLGRCEVRDCSGRMMLVEDMGDYLWAQCSVCGDQTGVGKVPAGDREPVRGPGRTDHSDDAFLGAM